MKNIKFYTVVVALAMIVSACGAGATPTADPNNVQNTAIAAAFTIVAQTQAAIPTATPIPPTETASPTPLPTDTPIPLPTLPALEPTQTQASSSSSGGGTDCLAPLNVGGAGPTHKTLIKNEIGGVKTLTISLQLWTPNKFGACGIIAASPGMVNLPSGSWYALAWITLNNGKNMTSSGSFYVQPAQFDKLELCIRKSDITYSPSC